MKQIYILLILFLFITSSAVQAQSCVTPVFADATAPPGTTSISMACGGGTANMSATFNGMGAVSTNLYSVSTTPFNFTTFTGTTIPIGSDDIWSSVVALPFNFCFFGNTYNQILIGSNGIISFDVSTAGGYCTYVISPPIPNTSYPRASIMGVYNDIDPRYGSPSRRIQYTTVGTAPCRQFIVSFEGISFYGSACPGTYANYQIILNETTNIIETHIQNHGGCSSTNSGRGIIGIQNYDRTVGYAAPGRNAVTFTTANEAWKFVPVDTSNAFRSMIVHLFENGVLVDSAVPYYAPFPTLRADFMRSITFPPDSHLFHIELMVYDSAGTGSGTSLCPVTTTGLYDFNDLLYYNGGSLNMTSAITNVSCYGFSDGAIDLTAITTSPPVSYVWSDGPTSEDRTGLTAGSYTVTASDLGGCTITQTINVTEPPMLMIMLDSIRDVACLGDASGSIQITTMGGTMPYLFNWTGGYSTEDIYSVPAGTYNINVVDSHGCVSNDMFMILPGTLDTSTLYHTICPSDSILLGGLWRRTGGTYYDTLNNSHGCDSIIKQILTVLPNVSMTLNPSICLGSSFSVAGSTYNATGVYYDTLTSYIGCDSILITNLTVNSPSSFTQNLRGCPGDRFFIGGANQTTAGTYYDTLTSFVGCDSVLTSILTYNSITTGTTAASICFGQTYFVGGANQNTAGVYYDTLVNSTGCDSILATTLTVNPSSSSNDNYSVCLGSSIFGFVVTGDTTLSTTLTNVYGCDSIYNQNITALPLPVANAGADQTILSGANAILNATGGTYYEWNTGELTASVTVTPTSTTTYVVMVTSADSCSAYDSVLVEVTLPSKTLVVPDAFTPNGDNLNDKFLPVNAKDYNINSFIIINRWGDEVYNVTTNTDGWDGKFLGLEQPAGAYVYYIEVTALSNGDKAIYQGAVDLIR